MSSRKDGIPNILDTQIDDGEQFFEGSIDLDKDQVNIPKTNSPTNDDSDDFDVDDDIIQSGDIKPGLDYAFKKSCTTCQLCLDDPQIHEVYRETSNITKVHEYIEREYSSTMTPPIYHSVRNHIQKHFLPVENQRTGLVRALNRNVDRRITQIENTPRTSEVNRVKAMASLILDETAATATNREIDARLKIEHIRLFNQTAKTIKEYLELELKCLGIDGGVTPEEMEEKVKNYIGAMVKEFSDPEEAKKFIQVLKKANIQL